MGREMPRTYDVIIVGAGPAGIFCALELTRKSDMKVLLLDKGESLEHRSCPSPNGQCRKCPTCATLTGWGGAGAYSDGKLTLSSRIGGWLTDLVPEKKVDKLLESVDTDYVKFGAPEAVFGEDEDRVSSIAREAIKSDLVLVPARVRHMGTENCPLVLGNMYDELKGRIDIQFKTMVESIRVKDGAVVGVDTRADNRINCRYLVAAPGRSGAEWFDGVAEDLGLSRNNNMVDIGVRVEVPSIVMEPLTDELYEPKLIYYSKASEDRVRTFCMNPCGEVIKERYDEVLTVNGHSFYEKKTDNTNFALLVDKRFTEPFHEPIAYGKYIARLANLLGDGIIVRMDRSTVVPTLSEATPGDLSLVLPFRYLSDILEMLSALDALVPGVHSRNTLLYGIEVKFYSSRLKVTSGLESQVHNLFAAGDGAGITRGLVQASASGLMAAESILKREKKA
jgi:uncharacterized FAD-dependent dehydrogenase